MDAHHHDLSSPALKEAAARQLQAKGERWTDMRSAVFGALANFDRPASAYDIAESVSASLGKRVAANSVYRILDLFVAANLATRVESSNAYIANEHPGCQHDCIFLICTGCGQTQHIDNDQLSQEVRSVARNAGFSPDRPIIEVKGRCKDCSG